MSLTTKISELLSRADDADGDRPPSERRGFWGWLGRVIAPGLAGVKLALAVVTALEVAAGSGALGEAASEVSQAIAAQIGRGAPPGTAALALAAIVLLDDGGKRAMSIAQKALRLAIRPLLNERHRTGRAEMQQEWEAWLQQQQEAGATWHTDYPPPGQPNSGRRRRWRWRR